MHLKAFKEATYGANTNEPTIRIRSALIFTLQALGWNGRFMAQ